jgi:cyclophilin family peptidyl-prolyl cis-trans isomerase
MFRLPLGLLGALLACLLALSACGRGSKSDSQGESGATPAPTTSETATGCASVDQPPAKSVKLPKPTTELAGSKAYVATVSTSCGDFQITLDAKRAPKTGGSFKYLADKGFFDGTTFHRIVPGFVIQGGDPKGDGSGGPGYKIVEAPPKDLQYTKGIVAMAKTDLDPAGTSGSQFFVVTGQDTKLPPEYALLGKVSGGQDVVDRIEATPADSSTGAPVDPIVIRSVKVAAT